MGKAIIQSHLGDGLYSVKIQFDNAKVEARKAQITAQITEIDTKLTDIAARKADAYAKFQADLSALNSAIDEFSENPSEISALTKTAYESKSAYDLIVSEERREKTKKTALEKEKQYLIDNCPAELTTNAWCVAKNTTLTGTTETIEVDYLLNRNGSQIEHDTGVWIPATQTQASPTPPTSILQHPMATSQHACWYNAAILPGAQRDQMRYRVGTISELNKDFNTCTVIFDGQSSINKFDGKTVPNLPIFPGLIDTVSATIEYPPCNGQAFENGDRVIVKNGNVVIGFYSNPRACQSAPPAEYLIEWADFYLPLVSAAQAINFQLYSGRIVPSGFSYAHFVEDPIDGEISSWNYQSDRGETQRAFVGTAYFDATLKTSVDAHFAYSIATTPPPAYYNVHVEDPAAAEYYLESAGVVTRYTHGVPDGTWHVQPGSRPHPVVGTYPPHYNEPSFWDTSPLVMRYRVANIGLDVQMTYDVDSTVFFGGDTIIKFTPQTRSVIYPL